VSSKQISLYGLLLLLLAGTGWFLFQQSSGLQPATTSATGPDAFIVDMDLKVMDEQGQLEYRVLARHMTHYPNDKRFTLEKPDIRIMQANGDTWHIKSEQGEATEAADIIWLLGAVDIKRPATETSSRLHIVTSDLLVLPEDEMAETDYEATITSDEFLINAVGMKADFNNDTLELRSRVRGRYDGTS
jgi:lipopolysaccharide export system protein LptC